MFSLLDLLLGFAGLAVPAAITLACWLLVAPGARRQETAPATHAHADPSVAHAGNASVAAQPVLESH